MAMLGTVRGQSSQIDSLKSALAEASNDTARVELLMNLANAEYQSHPDVAFDYSEKALHLATKANYHSGIADAHGWLAYLELNNRSHTAKAREHYVQALSLWTELAKRVGADPRLDSIQVYAGLSHSIINIGYVDELELNFSSALENYERGIDLGKKYGLHEHVASCYMNIGNIRKYQGDLPRALKNYELASELGRQHGLQSIEGLSLTATGTLWEDTGYLLEAKQLYSRALGIHRQQGDVIYVAACLNNLGSVAQGSENWNDAILYYDSAAVLALGVGALRSYCTYVNNGGSALSFLGKDDAAILKYEEALRLALENKISQLPALLLNNLARSYLKLGRTLHALQIAERAYRLAIEDGILLEQERSAELLSRIYVQVGRDHEAYDMSVLHMLLSNSLQGDKVHKLAARSVMKEEIRLEGLQDSLSRANESAASEREASFASVKAVRERTTSFTIAGIGLLLVGGGVVAVALDRRRRKHCHTRQTAQLQARAWRAQVNPHFIHTALQNINAYVQANERDLASSFLIRFARLMRAVLENARKDEVSLAEDLGVLRDYLELERLRLGGQLEYRLDVEPDIELEEIMVPPMLLQPYVEQVIWNHMGLHDNTGLLHIRVQRQLGNIVLTLQDNLPYDTVNQQAAPDRSNGTDITEARLALLMKQGGKRASVKVLPLPDGQRVELTLPLREAA